MRDGTAAGARSGSSTGARRVRILLQEQREPQGDLKVEDCNSRRDRELVVHPDNAWR